MQLKTLLASLEQPPLRLLNALARGQGAKCAAPPACHTMNEPDAMHCTPIWDDIEISALAYDSRQVQVGGLFVAVPGTHTDGRRFLADAAQRGALAAIGESLGQSELPLPYIEVRDGRVALANLACAFYNYPAQHLYTIGVP